MLRLLSGSVLIASLAASSASAAESARDYNEQARICLNAIHKKDSFLGDAIFVGTALSSGIAGGARGVLNGIYVVSSFNKLVFYGAPKGTNIFETPLGAVRLILDPATGQPRDYELADPAKEQKVAKGQTIDDPSTGSAEDLHRNAFCNDFTQKSGSDQAPLGETYLKNAHHEFNLIVNQKKDGPSSWADNQLWNSADKEAMRQCNLKLKGHACYKSLSLCQDAFSVAFANAYRKRIEQLNLSTLACSMAIKNWCGTRVAASVFERIPLPATKVAVDGSAFNFTCDKTDTRVAKYSSSRNPVSIEVQQTRVVPTKASDVDLDIDLEGQITN